MKGEKRQRREGKKEKKNELARVLRRGEFFSLEEFSIEKK